MPADLNIVLTVAAISWVAGRSPDPETLALAALERGDRERALTVLMEAYGEALYRFCRRLVGEETLADDVHQMTFVQAFEGLEGFGRRSTLRTWLFGIARHRALDALKLARRRSARFEPTEALPEPADDATGADELLVRSAARQVLEDCLGKLQPRVRSAVLLRFQQGLSFLEMAAVCRERAATLQARVARALPVLRRCLESRGVVP